MDPRLANLSLDVRQALGQLAHHRLRTALTLLGMVFGVGAVIAMVVMTALNVLTDGVLSIEAFGTAGLAVGGVVAWLIVRYTRRRGR